jgi:hypothetical protein
MELNLTIPLVPMPMARARSGRNGVHYTPAKQRNYMREVHALMLSEARKQGWEIATKKALTLAVVFVMPRAKSNRTKHHTQKPDASNLLKLLEDAGNGALYHDDSQITSVFMHKIWGVPARTEVRLVVVE